MKTLIIGASGQLGIELSKLFPDAIKTYSSHEIPGGIKLDVTNFSAVEDLILKVKPDVVINTVAFTDVDGCEKYKDKAYNINAEAVKHIVRPSRVVEAYLIHVSTDYVFDGEKGNYNENDIPNPINYYGLTKLMGEAYAMSYDDALIIRTSGVFRHKAFPVYVYKTLKSGKEVLAFKGYYSPISARKLANAIKELVELRKTGILNVAGERISRYDLALKIAEKFGFEKRVREVDQISTWVAKRPYDSSLDISRAKKLLSTDFYTLDLDGMVVD
ncbi:sugar nucleotide-binding protein [Sulfolobus sp. E5-1-F]|uniref:SDR family oxidoreductase n=1 Tax=Saccharolobus sp. E5-1-F TaxID=2663019 RepID=UPI001297475C|nr:NAD(P)-dependent oxidoreductase [Sulfolobus sp. E5-1-F]QGA53805.1 sugar nucleotide-binding protein [Sulfolobus sp. E5-1-F]